MGIASHAAIAMDNARLHQAYDTTPGHDTHRQPAA